MAYISILCSRREFVHVLLLTITCRRAQRRTMPASESTSPSAMGKTNEGPHEGRKRARQWYCCRNLACKREWLHWSRSERREQPAKPSKPTNHQEGLEIRSRSEILL